MTSERPRPPHRSQPPTTDRRTPPPSRDTQFRRNASVASALMTLHNNADQERTTNGNSWRPTASDVGPEDRRGLRLPTPTDTPPTTVVHTTNTTPIYGRSSPATAISCHRLGARLPGVRQATQNSADRRGTPVPKPNDGNGEDMARRRAQGRSPGRPHRMLLTAIQRRRRLPPGSGVTRLQWARVQVFQKGPLFPKKTF